MKVSKSYKQILPRLVFGRGPKKKKKKIVIQLTVYVATCTTKKIIFETIEFLNFSNK